MTEIISQNLATVTQNRLSRNQQDLLLAALDSRMQPRSTYPDTFPELKLEHNFASDKAIAPPNMSQVEDGKPFLSPDELDALDVDFTPDLDFLDGDQSFDFENADLGGEMIGSLPGSSSTADKNAQNGDHGEKRKNSSEEDLAEGDSKRQEVQEGEKSAKKPGRKPLTSEPTTKRKAQNRAAQRAFRERKEKHVKDLEIKVAELEKASEADKHENGLLKAQVERQQKELREYRKRLSLNGAISRSPTQSATPNQYHSTSASYGNAFDFEFPKFGALPTAQFPGARTLSQTSSPGILKHESPQTGRSPSSGAVQQLQSRDDGLKSLGRSISPQSNPGSVSSVPTGPRQSQVNQSFSHFSTINNMHGFASTLPQMGGASDLGDLFSPSILKSANIENYFDNAEANPSPKGQDSYNADNGGDSTAGLDRVFQFNSGSTASDSTSPSASSTSQWNVNGVGNSSCETSPEPLYDSPAAKEKSLDSDLTASRNGSALTQRQQLGTQQLNAPTSHASAFDLGNVDYSVPSMAGFDPILFDNYRDSQETSQGGAGFNSAFFDDALNSAPFDYGSPTTLFGILQSPEQTHASLSAPNNAPAKAMTPSRALLAETEKARDGVDDDYGLPSYKPANKDDDRKMISCNSIWNQLQSNQEFQEGKFDLDSLCSELRSKARCSESGLVVEQGYVDKALRRLGQKNGAGQIDQGPSHLMFDASSWDNVMKKFGSGSQ